MVFFSPKHDAVQYQHVGLREGVSFVSNADVEVSVHMLLLEHMSKGASSADTESLKTNLHELRVKIYSLCVKISPFT